MCERINVLNLQMIDIGFKLPPYLEVAQLEKIADIILEYREKSNIKFIVCCNTIPNGLALDKFGKPVLSSTIGGISYSIVNKLLGLSNVYQFRQYFNHSSVQSIKIIGCGGIKTADDVEDYLNAGADLVQIGSNNLAINQQLISN
jgi:dihydroorotate dehydrogenase